MIPKNISTSEDYQKFYDENFKDLPDSVRQRLLDDEDIKHMGAQMRSFKPEFSKEIIESCYAKTGRRGIDPMVIFRSLLLMISYGCLSITKWVKKVKADIALQFLIVFWKIPSVASHYDFINRVSKVEPHMDDDLYPKDKNPRPSWRKKKKKYKRGEKLNQDENKTKRLNEEYSKNPERDRNRLSRTLERIFDLLVVRLCMTGEAMPRNGYDKKLQTSMFRCPKATGRIKSCPYEKECNKTPYGRVLRVPDKTDPRLFGPFPYNSKRWKLMKPSKLTQSVTGIKPPLLRAHKLLT